MTVQFTYFLLSVTDPSYNSSGQYTAPVVLFAFLIGLQCCGFSPYIRTISKSSHASHLLALTLSASIEAGVSTM